jgi:hypothetical protein
MSWMLLTACLIDATVGEVHVDPSPDLDEDGVTVDQGDCDDLEARVGPDFAEVCDGLDNDCDGDVDGVTCDRTESFEQDLLLDVLFIIDGSCSMSEKQASVAKSVQDLVAPVLEDGEDVHIGVITMSMEDDRAGKLVEADGVHFADPSMTVDDATDWLSAAIQVGTADSWDEKARDPLASALNEQHLTHNVGFHRPQAMLSLVLLSDEDDVSADWSLSDLLDDIESKKGPGRVVANAVVGQSNSLCTAQLGLEHLSFVAATGGLTLDICEPDFGPFLSAVGQTAALQGLVDEYELAEPAESGSVEVDITLPGGLSYSLDPAEFALAGDGSTLVLTVLPPPVGSVLDVRYRSVL